MKKNVFANYLGAAVIAGAPVVALPWYLFALGPQQFGLVGFVAVLQSLMGLLDAGMSQALVREVAVLFHGGAAGKLRVASLLLGFERIYWIFAAVVAGVLASLSGIIASHWLLLGELPPETGQQALCGAAVLFLVQFPGLVYRSLMMGAQAQVQLNKIMVVGALFRHLGAVLVTTIWPTLAVYLAWNIGVSLIETLVRGRAAWNIAGKKRSDTAWDADQIRTLWKMIAGMSVATLLGALTVQIDKVIVSKMVGIEQFGYYMIAAAIATGTLQLVYPLVQAVLPQAVNLRNDSVRLRILSYKLLKLISMLVAGGALMFWIAGDWLLVVWLKNDEAVSAIHPVLSVLLIGSALSAFYNIGYIHWLVHEKLGRIFQVNAAAFFLSVFIIPVFIINFGVIGAAFGWVVINLIGFTFSLGWMRKLKSD